MLKTTSPIEGIKSEETTIVSSGVNIEGKVTSKGNVRIEGVIQGDIFSEKTVSVGQKGKVDGKINAVTINIGGKVSGTVNAKEKLTLGSNGDLKGDIITKILVIEEGAKFNGKGKVGG